MSIEENKAIIRRYIDEAWNKGNIDIIDELMAENYARHMGPGQSLNREEQKRRIAGFRSSFPDLHLAINSLIAEGDMVVFPMTLTGTQTGAYLGHTPTGKKVTMSIIDYARITNGKVVEHWGIRDEFSLRQQLGMIAS